jgi:APA family basic amino acid/polyamine antiporter
MRNVLGAGGATVIAAGIAVSSFGFLNLVILVSPRVYQTMSADGAFFPALARLHPRFRTPGAAIVFQGAWAILLTLTGSYGQLLDYVVFGDWIFFGLVVSTLFVYRRRDREIAAAALRVGATSGYRAWGYPVTPALFVLAAVYVVASSVASNPGNAAIGAFLLILGIPVYLYWKARTARKG